MLKPRFLSAELKIRIYIPPYRLNANQTPPPQHGSCQRLKGETDLTLRIGLRIH